MPIATRTSLFPYTTLFRSGHHDDFDLEHVDGELEYRQAVQVGMHDEVRDIAMDEQLARGEVDDLVGGHAAVGRSEEHTSELQSRENLVCRLLLEKKKHKQS